MPFKLPLLSAIGLWAAVFSMPAWAGAAKAQQAESSAPAAAAAAIPGGNSTYWGLPVRQIIFPKVPQPADQKDLLDRVPQKAGQPLDRELIRRSIQQLNDTGRFADIRAEEQPGNGGGIVLSFVTVPNYFIGDVSVTGNENHPTANQLVSAAKLRLGELFTEQKIDRAQDSIQHLMEENGYYKSTVNVEEHKHEDTQQIDILFHLRPGPQAHIGEVIATGDPGYNIDEIRDITGMHPGDPATARALTNALSRLSKKYQKQDRWLAQVSIARQIYKPKQNRVDYTFDVQPGPSVKIEAEGFKISQRVLKRYVPVYEENALDDDLLNEGRRNLLNYLQTRGYFDASIEVQKHGMHSRQMRVVYVINPGVAHKLARLDITGNHYFSTETLRPLLQVQPAGRFLSHGRYSQKLLSADIAALENLYEANGFEQVKVTSTVQDNYQGAQNQIAVGLHIDEGLQTIIKEVHVTGNASIPEDEFPPLYTAVGQPFSESNIATDREILLNFYFNRGFPDTTFEASAKPAAGAPNQEDVTFTIHEGKQVFIRDVLVSGLHYTKPYVANRELQMKSGDPLSQIDMLRTQQQLYDLGIFSQVDTAVQNPTGDEDHKNVLVHMKEAMRYTFTYGGGFEFQTGQPAGASQPQGNAGVSPLVSFGVTRLNFRGRDHTLTFKAEYGRLEQRVLASSDVPKWFNSDNWKLTLTALYDNTNEVSTFTSQRLEGSLQAEEHVGLPNTMVYSFTYRRVKSSNLELDPAQVPLLSFPVLVGMPGFGYIRNTRDNDLETTKGAYTSVQLGAAASYFGSDTDFSRLQVQNSTYYAFGKNRRQEKKFVFARSTQVGLENPFGNTIDLEPGQVSAPGLNAIPLPERFLMGGGNSHRGFGLNQAGPRDPFTGFPLGGSALFLNNLELRFPPPTLPFFQDNLSFAVFHDVGNVFTNGRDMLNSLLHWEQRNPALCRDPNTAAQCNYNYVSQAVGLGIRYKTPIGPVRFDFSYNLNPTNFPSCRSTVASGNVCPASDFVSQQARRFNVFFSIGQSF